MNNVCLKGIPVFFFLFTNDVEILLTDDFLELYSYKKANGTK